MGETITMGEIIILENSLLVSEIITSDDDYTTTDTFFYNDGDGLDENKLLL